MRQQREGHKTQEVYEQNNKFACASHFFVQLFTFLPYDDVKMPNFAFYGKRKQATTKFYFSLWT